MNHIKNGFGLKDTRPDENTVVLTIHGAVNDRKQFFLDLSERIEHDRCSLSFSGDCDLMIILTLYCPELNNTPRMAERAPLPELKNTRLFLDQQNYVVDHLEYIKVVNKPSYWYGTYQNMDSVLHRYFENLHRQIPIEQRPMDNVTLSGKFVEYPASWGLDRIDMRYGLLDNEYNYDVLGENIDVYVIDTGIRVTHEDFQNRANFLINTAGDNIDTDCAGHGTHVASLVGGNKYGAAKGVTMWAVKVLDCAGNGDTFTVVTGIMAAIEHSKTRVGRRAVASMSLGGDLSVTINNAVITLLNNRINAVVAAGNEYSNACDYTPSILGGSTNVITVGASTIQDKKPPWSNYGSCVSISAPGAEIIGAFHTSDSASKVLSGTSMATPFVSGIVAIILNQNLQLTVAEVKSLLLQWATPAIITGASNDGGGKNLLYSMIIISSTPPAPTPTLPPPIIYSDTNTLQLSMTLLMGFIFMQFL